MRKLKVTAEATWEESGRQWTPEIIIEVPDNVDLDEVADNLMDAAQEEGMTTDGDTNSYEVSEAKLTIIGEVTDDAPAEFVWDDDDGEFLKPEEE
jgi:hypothetical protein